MSYPTSTKSVKRYMGNTNKMEVHDLQRETSQCQISEIISAGHAVGFQPDTLSQAHSEGFDDCAYCLSSSQR